MTYALITLALMLAGAALSAVLAEGEAGEELQVHQFGQARVDGRQPFDGDAAHGARGVGQEMAAVGEHQAVAARHLQIRLVQQGGVRHVVGHAALVQLAAGQPAQLCVQRLEARGDGIRGDHGLIVTSRASRAARLRRARPGFFRTAPRCR